MGSYHVEGPGGRAMLTVEARESAYVAGWGGSRATEALPLLCESRGFWLEADAETRKVGAFAMRGFVKRLFACGVSHCPCAFGRYR